MIKRIDHLVLTTQKPWECLAFYEALGFTRVETAGRYELRSRNFKIDVHVVGLSLIHI